MTPPSVCIYAVCSLKAPLGLDIGLLPYIATVLTLLVKADYSLQRLSTELQTKLLSFMSLWTKPNLCIYFILKNI